ncbi:MAG: hypothetical protein ACR2LY_08355 [Thermoleophilaceae bacterium]
MGGCRAPAGPGVVLSHRSAAAMWGLTAGAPGRVEVSAPTRRRPAGVDVHRTRLHEDEVTELENIPLTTASRTLLDLAAVLPRNRLERALREAEVSRLGDAASLAVLLERHPRRRGTAALRSILASGRVADGVTRSELEERFLVFLDANALPRPQLNVHLEVHGRLLECGCVWRARRPRRRTRRPRSALPAYRLRARPRP